MEPSTTPTAKEQVLAWVRERNLQTMKLKFGCRVKYKQFYEDAEPSILLGIVLSIDEPQSEIAFSGKVNMCGGGSCSPKWILEIFGSDMGKQEFEIALRTIHGKNRVHVGWHSNCPFGDKGFFEGMFVYHIQTPDGSINLPYDLNQNLHNQPDEFYLAILPLITHDN